MIDEIIHGDCLIESDKINSGSVDLILTDPPYGNMKGISNPERPKSWGKPDYWKWDEGIEPTKLYAIANRILRKNGRLALFAQQPYTTELIKAAIPSLPHSYNIIWEKNDFANALLCNKAPVSFYEDILVFSKTHDHEALHPLRAYFKQVMDFIGLNKKEIIDRTGQRACHTFRTDSAQYRLCAESTYNELIQTFAIDRMEGFKTFAELKPIDEQFKKDLPSTFNLWEGKKYKSNILKYKKDYNGYHPTQKPVLLLEDLIKTFSNEGDLVVDLTAGSGSTAVASINTGRRYIIIEKEEKYVNIARERIKHHAQQMTIGALL